MKLRVSPRCDYANIAVKESDHAVMQMNLWLPLPRRSDCANIKSWNIEITLPNLKLMPQKMNMR